MRQIPEKESGEMYALGLCLHRKRDGLKNSLVGLCLTWPTKESRGNSSLGVSEPVQEARRRETAQIERIQKERDRQEISGT